jgi:hypothetical protein
MLNREGVVYEERAPHNTLMKHVLTLASLALASFYAAAIFKGDIGFGEDWSAVHLTLLAAVLVLVLALWSFFNMSFSITEEGVVARMPPFRHRVPFSNIKEVKRIEKIPWWVGWGLRVWGRRLAFVSRHAEAVAIVKKHGFFRELVLTTRHPEDFALQVRKCMEKF